MHKIVKLETRTISPNGFAGTSTIFIVLQTTLKQIIETMFRHVDDYNIKHDATKITSAYLKPRA